MKILFLLTQDLESPAGAGRYFPLAKELVRLNHEVTIAALHGDFSELRESRFIKDGVQVQYVSQMHVLKKANQKIYFPAPKLLALTIHASWNLSRAAFTTPADIVHIGKPHPMNSIAGLSVRYLQLRLPANLPLKKGTRRKYVLLDYDDYEAASGYFPASWQRWPVAFCENFVPRHVHHVTTHNHFLKDRLISLGIPEERITYLPNGVDLERFKPPGASQVERLRSELNLVGKKVIAFIGTLSLPSHPLDLLIKAFQIVHQVQPDSILLIVGGGGEYNRLVEETHQMGLNNVVHFCGRIPAKDIAAYYRLADVSVDPVYHDLSAQARLPLKLFESWISEVPFITGDVGDRREVLGSPPAGMLALPGNPDALAACILQVFQSPELADELRCLGLTRVKQYSWQHLAQQLENRYQQIIQQKACLINHP
ncbi:MAG: glycosyltransferase family 4 protein [Anaerolineales bacterium]|nr:glycosyltransferase family 4 protein [Anaerolineales bacterium]